MVEDAISETKASIDAEESTLDKLYQMVNLQKGLIFVLKERLENLQLASYALAKMESGLGDIYKDQENISSKLEFSLESPGAALLFATVKSSPKLDGTVQPSETLGTLKT